MPVITINHQEFKKLIKKDISIEQIIKQLPMIGADIDKIENDTISIEFFPDRPDLFSIEGVVRATRAFLELKTGLQTYPIESSDITIYVDESVKKVRPYIRCALIKNIQMSDDLIISLMDLQEKLHFGIGRNRKKVAIGVHNFDPVQEPFTYKAVEPNSIQFIPLGKDDSMTLNDILQNHEKGISYAHLLKDSKLYPIITDKNNNVLSFPPIINGTLTEVTPFTTNIFIDVTGTNLKSVNTALNIITTALAERNAIIHSTRIREGNKTIISPDLSPSQKILSTKYINRILGTDLNKKQIIKNLEKMGYAVQEKESDKLNVFIPAWRSDILHEIDLVEDVAIGYGYDNFNKELPKGFTFGKHLIDQQIRENLRTIMIGFGFNEVTTFTISNKIDEFKKLGIKKAKCVELLNPITEEYTCIRTTLLPSLLKILNDNKHHNLPQQIFEIGIVVQTDYKNTYHLGAVRTSAKAHFTECKALIEGVVKEIGLSTYDVIENNHPAFVQGRCASLTHKNQEIGFFGEFHPNTILNFDLEHPIIGFEIFLDSLKKFI
jgi:phenylalanyl-tRNA synthetase beta chain